MSTISFSAGDMGWIDSHTCDFCGAKDERYGTGKMERVELSISDPRRAEARALSPEYIPLPEIEYEERRFKKDSHVGWGSFGVVAVSNGGLGPIEPRQRMDLCPECAAIVGDFLLERSKSGGWGTCEEKQYGNEVPRRPVPPTIFRTDGPGVITTNLRASGELGEAIGDHPILTPAPPGPCVWRTGSIGQICGRPAMSGQWHCYEHAALGG